MLHCARLLRTAPVGLDATSTFMTSADLFTLSSPSLGAMQQICLGSYGRRPAEVYFPTFFLCEREHRGEEGWKMRKDLRTRHLPHVTRPALALADLTHTPRPGYPDRESKM